MMRRIEKAVRQMVSIAGRGPYKLIYTVIKLLLQTIGNQNQIWIRNSYILGSFEAGFSDLDLSVLISENRNTKLSERNKKYFNSIVKFFQKVWPFLGEINYYNSATVLFVSRAHNTFELQRDPQLVRINSVPRTADMFEAAVFLLRQLEKDLNNLKYQPEKRMKKWQSHFFEIDNKFPEMKFLEKVHLNPNKMLESIVSAIRFLSRCWNPVMGHDVEQKLLLYLELLQAKADFGKLQKLPEWDAWFFVWGASHFPESALGQHKLSDDQLKFYVRQMRWEICGVITQSFAQEQREQSCKHIKKLNDCIHKIAVLNDHPEMQELIKIYQAGLSFYQN